MNSLRAILTMVMLTAVVEAVPQSVVDADELIRQRLDEVLAQLPPQVQGAAAAIPDPGRRLLAVRAYLRAGEGLAARWSWSSGEASAFNDSAPSRELQRAISVVQCVFNAANPGYSLYVNPEFRNIGIQLERWNQNESVGLAARRLLAQLRREAATAGVADGDAAVGTARLRLYLSNHAPEPVPTLAAPGLSPHGQVRAIDFQVRRGDRIIASTRAAAIESEWERTGWAKRLADAVVASGEAFEGPLRSPREPWHFSYSGRDGVVPQPVSPAASRCAAAG
jgi:GNAT superfamily N-acetyltransferase